MEEVRLEPLNGSQEPLDMSEISIHTIDQYNHCRRYLCCSCSCSGQKEKCCSPNWWINDVFAIDSMNMKRICVSYFYGENIVFILRSVCVLYSTIILFTGLYTQWDAAYWFVYFTHLSYLGLWLYLVLAMTCSILYKLGDRKNHQWLVYITSFFYTMAYSYHILVPVVYWCLLGRDYQFSQHTEEDQWLQVSQHGLDYVLIFFEFMNTRILYHWGHLLVSIMILLLYIFWAWLASLIWPTGGPLANGIPYFFLQYWQAQCYLYIVGIAVFVVLIWIYAFSTHWFKVWIYYKFIIRKQ